MSNFAEDARAISQVLLKSVSNSALVVAQSYITTGLAIAGQAVAQKKALESIIAEREASEEWKKLDRKAEFIRFLQSQGKLSGDIDEEVNARMLQD